MASIAIEKVSKVFRHGRPEIQALKDLQLDIPPGELLAILGPSGSGKTTLLRLVAGLETPEMGDIRIDGKSMRQVPPHGRNVAMVFQSGALFPHLTAYENIAVGLKLRKVPAAEREQRIREVVDALKLADCLSRLPPELSTGQRQRVALARAIVRRPKIFLLDEPLANLDIPLRAELRAEIVRLRRQLNATMIYVTHDQSEAMSIGDRVAVLREGTLEQIAAPAVIYAQPANTFVARFVGSPPMNLLAGTLLREANAAVFTDRNTLRIRLAAGLETPLHAYAAKSILLGVRPEDIAISSSEVDDGNLIEASIEWVERTGPDVYLHALTGPHRLTLRAPQNITVRPNTRLWIKPGPLHFFDPDSGLRLND